MEFCERSTLRNCIDAGLCLDINRLWRLFREIVEGLVHIHEQVILHFCISACIGIRNNILILQKKNDAFIRDYVSYFKEMLSLILV